METDASTLMNLGKTALALLAVGMIVVGLVECFFGFRLFKLILGLVGFGLGALLTAGIATMASAETPAVILLGLIGGVAGAWLLVAAYYLGLFVVGTFLGVLAGSLLLAAADSDWPAWLVVVPGLAGGFAAIALHKLMIVLSTAFGGAWTAMLGVFHFVAASSPLVLLDDPSGLRKYLTAKVAFLVCWLVLAVVGIAVQYESTPSEKVEAEAEE